jgi:predicted small secreted protein
MKPSARTCALAQDRAVRQRRATLFGLAIVMAGGLMLSACNTTAGAGQDVKATGAAITRGANNVKNGM